MVQKFVIQTTSTTARSRGIAILQAVNLLGIALGPATNFLLAHTDFKLFAGIEFTKYTGAGFLMTIYHLVNACLALALYVDPPPSLHQDTPEGAVLGLWGSTKAAWGAITERTGACHVM